MIRNSPKNSIGNYLSPYIRKEGKCTSLFFLCDESETRAALAENTFTAMIV